MLRTNSLLLFCLLVAVVLLNSCANRVAPTGGKKDEIPPVLNKCAPANYSTNLNSKKILMYFDEYIQLKDLNNQLVISPLMDPEPKIVAKKGVLEIFLPDSLKPQTTYTLNFGNAVADLNEGNSIPDFQYVFSTGDVLDSLVCSGSLLDAYSHKTEKAITVMLYKDTIDSLPFKKLPDYFTRTNEQGNFKIKNISPGTYKLFALQDKNSNFKCDNPIEEAVAFSNDLIVVPDSIVKPLSLFYQRPAKLFVKKATVENNGPVIVSFNQSIENLSWTFLENQKKLAIMPSSISSENDSLLLWVNDSTIDSLKFVVFNNQIAFDTVVINLVKKKGFSRERGERKNSVQSYTTNVSSGSLKPADTLYLLFQNPLGRTITNQFFLTQDSVPVKNFKVEFDDSLHRKLVILSEWKENAKYQLLIPSGSLIDIFNNESDTLLFNFVQLPVSDFGSLITSFSGLESNAHYQLQLVNENLQIIKQSTIGKSGKCTFENITPANYKVRLLADSNNNNKWDTGEYWKKIQPEEFFYYPQPVQIRANWELEINIEINK